MQAKLLLYYDVVPSSQESYHQFVKDEFLAEAYNLGLTVTEVWHTAYGDYPMLLAGFVAEDFDEMVTILNSAEWQALETKLRRYVRDYRRKVVPFRGGFQI
jgi:hypothetical protein